MPDPPGRHAARQVVAPGRAGALQPLPQRGLVRNRPSCPAPCLRGLACLPTLCDAWPDKWQVMRHVSGGLSAAAGALAAGHHRADGPAGSHGRRKLTGVAAQDERCLWPWRLVVLNLRTWTVRVGERDEYHPTREEVRLQFHAQGAVDARIFIGGSSSYRSPGRGDFPGRPVSGCSQPCCAHACVQTIGATRVGPSCTSRTAPPATPTPGT